MANRTTQVAVLAVLTGAGRAARTTAVSVLAVYDPSATAAVLDSDGIGATTWTGEAAGVPSGTFRSDGIAETAWEAAEHNPWTADGIGGTTWDSLVDGRRADAVRSDGASSTAWTGNANGDASFRSGGVSSDSWLARLGVISEGCLAGDGEFAPDEGEGGAGAARNYVF